MIKKWLQFNNESIETNETINIVEDLFLGVADKWRLDNSEKSHSNSWYVAKDHIIYGSNPPKVPKSKLFIYIDRKRFEKFSLDLDKFFLRLQKFGYNASRDFECSLKSQKYLNISILPIINESIQFRHPDDIRVTEEEFLDKESKLERQKFSDKEIQIIKEITDKEKSYLGKCQYRLEPGYVNNTITFETTCGHFYLIIIKFEDEWFLIEERPKYGRGSSLSRGFFIADGFDQLCEYLKWYV